MEKNNVAYSNEFTGSEFVKWIACEYKDESTHEPLFRKNFVTNDKAVASAKLYATARGYYEFWLNGCKVGDQFLTPGWSDYFHTIMYQVYDVTNMISHNQENVIGAMTGKGWFSGPHQMVEGNYNLYGDHQSVIAQLVITYEDGSMQEVATDETWLYTAGPIFYADNYRGEGYDARLACDGWSSALYKMDEDCWQQVKIVPPPAFNNQLGLPAPKIVLQTDPPVREIARFSPAEITTLSYPKLRTFDIGQNIAGFVNIKVRGGSGDKIIIKHAEMLNTPTAYQECDKKVGNGDGPIGTIYRENLRDAFAAGNQVAIDTYILSGNPNGEEWAPRFAFHGFRYFEISGADVEILHVEAIAISTDNKMLSHFECSNPKVNQIYSNVKWSMLGNHVGVPTDCPNRDERLAYTGDAQIFALTATYLQDVYEFYSRWLRDVRDYQSTQSGLHAGLVPVLAPNDPRTGNFSTQWSAGWGDAIVIIPWHMYQMYGNAQIIHDSYNSMRDWCDFLLHADRTQNNLRRLGGASRDNNYGDWVAVPHDLPDDYKRLTGSLFMAHSCNLFSKMAYAIGDPQGEADEYAKRAQLIVDAIVAEYFDRDGYECKLTHSGMRFGGGYEDGYTSDERREKQTAYAMMLYFNLDPDRNQIYAKRLAEIIADNGGKLSSGFIGVSYLAPVLADNGYAQEAFDLLEQEECPSWIYSINQGATTIWERWNSYTIEGGFGPVAMNSFNHYAFGSIGEWLMSGILGIKRDESSIENVGFRKFILYPHYGGTLTQAKGHYDSYAGKIESAWELKPDNIFEFKCTVPTGACATVFIPSCSEQSPVVCNNGVASGTQYVKYDSAKKRAVYFVEGGSYCFVSKLIGK